MRFLYKKILSTVLMSLLTSQIFSFNGPHQQMLARLEAPSRELLSKIKNGTTIKIKSLRNNKYFAARKIGEKWRLRANAVKTDLATLFTALRLGDWIGIQSKVAGNFNLASEPESGLVGFMTKNFLEWEQWVLVGSELKECLLQSRSTLGFLSNRPENWPGGRDNAWTKDQRRRPTMQGPNEALAIEIVKQGKKPTLTTLTAQAHEAEAITEQIAFYDKALNMFTGKMTQAQRSRMVNKNLFFLVDKALLDPKTKSDSETLNNLIALLNKAIGKVSLNLTETQKRPLINTLSTKIEHLQNAIKTIESATKLKTFKASLEAAEKTANYTQKLEAYEKLKRYLFFQMEYKGLFMNALNKLITDRTVNQLKPLGNMIQSLTTYAYRLINIMEGKNLFVPAAEVIKYTQLSKEELITIVSELEKKKAIATQPIAFEELINRANAQLLTAANKPETKQAWLTGLTYLADNMAKQSKENINTLEGLANAIDAAIDPTNSFTEDWRNKFSDTEKKNIRTQIAKILKPQPIVKPTEVKKPVVKKEERSPQEFGSVLEKAKRALDLDSIHQSDLNRKQWLTDLAFLSKNKMGQSIRNLKEFNEFIKNIDENYLAFGLWFNQFPAEDQTRLQEIITRARRPLDYAAVLAATYKTLSDGSNVKTDITKEIWLNNFEFLSKRSKGQSEENLKTLDRIVKTVQKWIKFPSWIRKFSGASLVRLRRITRESATALEVALVFPYEPFIINAQDATSLIDLEGKPGKISLYEKAIDAVTENVPFKKRLDLLKEHIAPLVKDTIHDEKSGKDIEILKKLSAMLTQAKGKLSPGIEEKEKKQINTFIESKVQEITKTVKSIQQGAAIQSFKEKIDNAKATTTYTAKVDAFKALLAEVGTSPERKGLFMTEVKTLIDNRRRNQLPTLTSLLSYIVGSASYDPALKKANFSIDELNKLKKQASKPLAYAEVIKRTSDHLSNAIESDAKRKLWIANLNYLINNIAGKSKKDVEAVKLLFTQTIYGNLMYNPEWANKFTAEEKATISSLIEKVKATKVTEKKLVPEKPAVKVVKKKPEEKAAPGVKPVEKKVTRPKPKRRVRR